MQSRRLFSVPLRALGVGPLLGALASCAGGEAPAAEQDWTTPFEASGGTATATYEEGIDYYQRLAEAYPQIDIRSYGATDAGPALHLVTLSLAEEFDPAARRDQGIATILVMNAIHAGETDGVDATMMWIRDMVQNPDAYAGVLDSVAVAVIPFFNVGGVLNRSPFNRVNQNGPAEMGFRGNARHYNLNRDLTKGDTRNVQTFWEIFHDLDPELFVDNHVSNGADFQHVVTQVYSEEDKLGGELGTYLASSLWPAMTERMAGEDLPMVPYVSVEGGRPEDGWVQYLDTPRFTTGYTSLFHTIGFMPELHMLKPYDQRVRAAYTFMEQLLREMAEERTTIQELRARAKQDVQTQEVFPIYWEVDRDIVDSLPFRGYAASERPSAVTGAPRMVYDRTQPWEANVPYYGTFRPTIEVTRPAAYVIPQQWREVIDRMAMNGVRMDTLMTDTTMAVDVYTIEDYTSRSTPYEGHFFHDEVTLSSSVREMAFRAGDVVIPTDQWVNRYIVETLEPQAHDSFFRWNFFDPVLARHEGYSGYVFEETAAAMLRNSTELRTRFEAMREGNVEFAADPGAQLDWIFENSAYYEEEFMRYPVYRVPR